MMKITNKLLLATAIALVVIGLAIAVVALYLNNWSFAFGYDSTKEVATHEINESIRDISINTDTADVIFIHTNDSEAKIVVMPFSLHYSNIALTEAIPLLVYNIFEYFFPQTVKSAPLSFISGGRTPIRNSRASSI